MEQSELFAELKQAVIEGDEEKLVNLVQDNLDSVDPLAIVEDGMMPGMTEVGNRFSAGEVYLPEMLMAAEAWEQAVHLLLRSAVELTRAALPGMKERGFGRVITVTSVAVKQPVDGLTPSHSIRAAGTGFAPTLANLLDVDLPDCDGRPCPGFPAALELP